jgi:hypothetical protein
MRMPQGFSSVDTTARARSAHAGYRKLPDARLLRDSISGLLLQTTAANSRVYKRLLFPNQGAQGNADRSREIQIGQHRQCRE